MSFKLSAQLDFAQDPKKPFEVYRSYIEENIQRFPKSVLDILENKNWSGGSDSTAPYYSEVTGIQVRNFGKPEAQFELNLRKEMYTPDPIKINLKYSGLIDLHIPVLAGVDCNPMIWHYEQFLFVDIEANQKAFKHQI